MPSLEVAGTMDNPNIDCQMRAVESSWDQVVEASLSSGNFLAADMAPTTVAVIDGLGVDGLTRRSPFSGHSPQSLLANLFRVRLHVALLRFMRRLKVERPPFGSIAPLSLFKIGWIPGFLKLPPILRSLFGVLFAPTSSRLSLTSAGSFRQRMICTPLAFVVGMFSRPALPIGERSLWMFGTPACLVFAGVGPFGFIQGHRYAAFPGTASSYLTAPVRAA